MLKIIVAIGNDGAIGRGGDLIWSLPGDLKRFKQLTMDHAVIMGRKTWESLPKKPLPGRRNIVLTRNEGFSAEGAEVVHTVQEALERVKGEDAFIMGGGEIYNLFMPYAEELLLTAVDTECADADTFLQIDKKDWRLEDAEDWQENPEGVRYRYERRVR